MLPPKSEQEPGQDVDDAVDEQHPSQWHIGLGCIARMKHMELGPGNPSSFVGSWETECWNLRSSAGEPLHAACTNCGPVAK